jgi:hypothetical protein
LIKYDGRKKEEDFEPKNNIGIMCDCCCDFAGTILALFQPMAFRTSTYFKEGIFVSSQTSGKSGA